MLTYFQALSDVAEALHNYRKERSGLTTEEGKVLDDIQDILIALHREEQRAMDRWMDDSRHDDTRVDSYGGTE